MRTALVSQNLGITLGEGTKVYRLELFKNTEKAAKHQPDYIVFVLEP